MKIFLTADAEQRAQRRYKQLIAKGDSVNLAFLLEEIRARDKRDMERSLSPLIADANAIEIDSTQMSIDKVLATVLALANDRGLNRH